MALRSETRSAKRKATDELERSSSSKSARPEKQERKKDRDKEDDVKKPPPGKEKPGDSNGHTSFDHSRPAEEYGIVNRKYYPPELSNERCAQYNNGEIPRPITTLENALSETQKQRDEIPVGDAVVHWFKRDLRLGDNRALSLASTKAKEHGNSKHVIAVFILSPQDYEAHQTSSAKINFELRSLEVVQRDLAELHIPLHIEIVSQRKRVPTRLIELCQGWNAKHVFCNIEYEVDELRREESLVRRCLNEGIAFSPVHDDVIVAPGELKTGPGRQFSVYSPWYRAWTKHIHQHPKLLDAYDVPSANPESARTRFKALFESSIPPIPSNLSLVTEDKKRLESLWPAGEHEAADRLEKFLKEKSSKYQDTRNFPAKNSTSMLSVHFAAGTLAARTAVRTAQAANSTKKLDGGSRGISGWISEVAWRDFYKHVLCAWPYVCMNKSFKYEYSDIEWEYNMEHFQKWCNGQTGYPFIDAGMRQLRHTGYMHNRVRMGVASFLSKDLLLDWRLGEQHFIKHLIDGDFASNNGGWGFSASSGVDPQPYFRIFNPVLQGERFDPDGEYIRKWVPELQDVRGNAIHDPYARGFAKEAEKAGYPTMIVDHKQSRARALDRYKRGLKRDTA